MAASKLFTPKLHLKRGTAADSTDRGFFVNPPAHPTVQRFEAPTDKGEACYPLKLGADSGQSTQPVGQRNIKQVQIIEREE